LRENPSAGRFVAEEVLAAWDAQYDEARGMTRCFSSDSGYHTKLPAHSAVHGTRPSLEYAVLLLQSGRADRMERVERLITGVLDLQQTDPYAATYGIWPWYLEEPLDQMGTPDWNWADFCGGLLAQMLAKHGDPLPAALRGRMREALGHAGWSIFRRNVSPSYTNIAVMGGWVAAAAGELLDEPRLLDYGRRRLVRMVQYTAEQGGFNEYNSPMYTLLALIEAERALHLVADAKVREAAEALRQESWRMIADHYHPGTKQWAGPHARCYSDCLSAPSAAMISQRVGVAIPVHPEAGRKFDLTRDGGVGTFPMPCPDNLRARFTALPEDPTEIRQRFIRRDSDESSTWGTTWLSERACLGSVNRGTFWTQGRPVLGYWTLGEDHPPAVLRLRFLHDGRDFASGAVYTRQIGPRVVAALGLKLQRGDHHPYLDCPAGGLFEAEDFRLRCELQGHGARIRAVGPGRWELAAGGHRAVVHGGEGWFDGVAVRWEAGESEGRVYVEAICYHGARRGFDLAKLERVGLGLGIELLEGSAAASAGAIRMEWGEGESYWVRWEGQPGLESAGLEVEGSRRAIRPLANEL